MGEDTFPPSVQWCWGSQHTWHQRCWLTSSGHDCSRRPSAVTPALTDWSPSGGEKGVENDMMTSSNGYVFRVIGPLRGIHRSPVNSPHKGQWRGALMLSLICAWINDWVNNREAGDLRRHCAHYDVMDVVTFQIGNTLESKLIRHWSHRKVSNQFLIGGDPRLFAIWYARCYYNMQNM